jgi:putative ABC transport system ATP-binding protein
LSGTEQPLVALHGVTRQFREGARTRDVLRGVDLEIARGETAVLLGPSGSGKSTLLNLVSGIDAPDAGRVIVDGVDLTRLSERDRTLFRRDRIGFVFQFFNLIATLTVEENVLFPVELKSGLSPDRRRAALELLDAVGLGDRRRAYPDVLSGGEQQRVAIARALAHDPALVLADEPTGNLDAATGESVVELLDRLVRRRGRTMIIVTHAQHLLRLADRVLELRDGSIAESAKVQAGGPGPPAPRGSAEGGGMAGSAKVQTDGPGPDGHGG